MKKYTCVIFVATVVLWTLVIFNFCGCTTVGNRGPAKQQRSNTSPQLQATPATPIPISLVDLNNDGKIDISEQQRLTESKPGVITTFLCIGGATILICLGTAWLSRNVPPTNTSKKIEIEDEEGIPVAFEPAEDQILEESEPSGDWLDSGQDFESGGKRR